MNLAVTWFVPPPFNQSLSLGGFFSPCRQGLSEDYIPLCDRVEGKEGGAGSITKRGSVTTAFWFDFTPKNECNLRGVLFPFPLVHSHSPFDDESKSPPKCVRGFFGCSCTHPLFCCEWSIVVFRFLEKTFIFWWNLPIKTLMVLGEKIGWLIEETVLEFVETNLYFFKEFSSQNPYRSNCCC